MFQTFTFSTDKYIYIVSIEILVINRQNTTFYLIWIIIFFVYFNFFVVPNNIVRYFDFVEKATRKSAHHSRSSF